MVDSAERNSWDKPVRLCPIQIYRKECFLALFFPSKFTFYICIFMSVSHVQCSRQIFLIDLHLACQYVAEILGASAEYFKAWE
jgi:hypothetical protein